MKHLFVLIALILFGSSLCAQTIMKVGLTSGSLKNKDIIIRYFNEVLESQDSKERVNDVRLSVVENEFGGRYYMLLGFNNEEELSRSIATVVFQKGDNLYLTRESLSKGVATCYGCSGSCSVMLSSNMGYYCDDLTDCGLCNKTVTIINSEWLDTQDPVKMFYEHYKNQ